MADVVNGLTADEDEARLAPQPRAGAIRAGSHGHVGRQFLLHHRRVGLAPAPLDVGHDAFERMLAHVALIAFADVVEADLIAPRAFEDELLHGRGQPFERRVEIEARVGRETFQHLVVELVAAIPSFHGTRGERELRKRHHALRIEETHFAQAVATRARTHGAVEREQARFQFGQRVVAQRTRETRRVGVLTAAIQFHHDGAAARQTQRGFEGFREPLLHFGADLEAVHHDLDRVLAVLRERRWRIELGHFAVDPHPHETLRAQILEDFELLPLALHDHGRQDHHARVFRQCEHGVHHLRDGLGRQRDAVGRAMRFTDTGEQQPQIVVNLRHRTDGGAGVVAGGALLDRDRRRQTLDQVHVRLFHELQELACVRRQRFHVAALTLRVQRVEGERRFARTRQARDRGP
jgi:hypothetical protein